MTRLSINYAILIGLFILGVVDLCIFGGVHVFFSPLSNYDMRIINNNTSNSSFNRVYQKLPYTSYSTITGYTIVNMTVNERNFMTYSCNECVYDCWYLVVFKINSTYANTTAAIDFGGPYSDLQSAKWIGEAYTEFEDSDDIIYWYYNRAKQYNYNDVLRNCKIPRSYIGFDVSKLKDRASLDYINDHTIFLTILVVLNIIAIMLIFTKLRTY